MGRARGLTTSAPGVTDDAGEWFWLRHLRLGVVLYLLSTAGGIAYLLLTPDGRRRGFLEGAVAVSCASSLIVMALPARRIVTSRLRLAFFVGWTAFSIAFIVTIAALDEGAGSPLALLLFVPLVFVALAYPSEWVAAIGATTLVAYGVLALADDVSGDGPFEVMLATLLLAVSVVATVTSRNRERLEMGERALRAQLVELAERDGLTGCLNHRVFYERLADEVDRSRRYGRPLSLLLLDVDRFKQINDRHGHVLGDEVLAAIGDLLRREARAVDIVGRTGGDEFAVLLPETTGDRAATLAQRLSTLAPELQVENVPVALSIGLAAVGTAVPVPADPRDLVRIADRSLYDAKRRRARGIVLTD